MRDPAYAVARSVLIDALTLLHGTYARDSIVVVGAQAIYIRTSAVAFGRAPYTIDSDFALNPDRLEAQPPIKAVLLAAGYRLHDQPGTFAAPRAGAEHAAAAHVDLLVPEAWALGGGRRDANLPGSNERASRRTDGLELALVDHDEIDIVAFDGSRSVIACVAGYAALLVSKVVKLGERRSSGGRRLKAKDIGDVLRILQAARAGEIAEAIARHSGMPRIDTALRTARRHLTAFFLADRFALSAQLLREWILDEDDFEIADASLRQLVSELASDWPA